MLCVIPRKEYTFCQKAECASSGLHFTSVHDRSKSKLFYYSLQFCSYCSQFLKFIPGDDFCETKSRCNNQPRKSL